MEFQFEIENIKILLYSLETDLHKITYNLEDTKHGVYEPDHGHGTVYIYSYYAPKHVNTDMLGTQLICNT